MPTSSVLFKQSDILPPSKPSPTPSVVRIGKLCPFEFQYSVVCSRACQQWENPPPQLVDSSKTQKYRVSTVKRRPKSTTKTMNVTKGISPTIKKESEQEFENDDVEILSPLLPPPIMPDTSFIAGDDSDEEFLRLTAMVREVYFSHLYKSLISNYVMCCQSKDEFSRPDLKRCASLMELDAVRASLEATLYRQTMLKMISDVKAQTSVKKVHKKLGIFLNSPQRTSEVGVQTDKVPTDKTLAPDTTFVNAKDSHVQSSSVTSNYDESVVPKCDRNETKEVQPQVESEKFSLDERVSLILKSETVGVEAAIVKCEKDRDDICQSETTEENLDLVSEDVFKSIEDFACLRTQKFEQAQNDVDEIFGDDNTVDITMVQNDNNDSQDSILQHMEDMFCESNDTSDLMTLIEKHSGVSKANVDLEIGMMCPVIASPKPFAKLKEKRKDNTGESSEVHKNKRKLSFSNYKKMKKRARGEPDSPKPEETEEEKKKRKASGVWFVERIHQVSKLKAKMTEISVSNYRKHGRIKAKFLELFGESDEEEMMPDSPICIEDHLNDCKERIAPWVVKHLMPFYKKNRIADRKLFKTVAKHVVDKLIFENTFPEENDVSKYVQKYFKNKKIIKTKPDVYI